MAVKGPVMESGFSFRLWRSLFLITLHAFAVTGSEGVRDGVAFLALAKSDLSKSLGLYYQWL